jgi:hypothetical protein
VSKLHAPKFRFVRDFKGLREFCLAGDVFSQMNTRMGCVKVIDDYLHDAEVNPVRSLKTCADKQESAA